MSPWGVGLMPWWCWAAAAPIARWLLPYPCRAAPAVPLLLRLRLQRRHRPRLLLLLLTRGVLLTACCLSGGLPESQRTPNSCRRRSGLCSPRWARCWSWPSSAPRAAPRAAPSSLTPASSRWVRDGWMGGVQMGRSQAAAGWVQMGTKRAVRGAAAARRAEGGPVCGCSRCSTVLAGAGQSSVGIPVPLAAAASSLIPDACCCQQLIPQPTSQPPRLPSLPPPAAGGGGNQCLQRTARRA